MYIFVHTVKLVTCKPKLLTLLQLSVFNTSNQGILKLVGIGKVPAYTGGALDRFHSTTSYTKPTHTGHDQLLPY